MGTSSALVRQFESAVTGAAKRPKAVKLGRELWVALKAANLIEMRSVAAWGIFDLGFELPFYKDVCIIHDPELDASDRMFVLPPTSTGGTA